MYELIRTWIAILELSRILAGESPSCDLSAKVALSYVHERNIVWYADADPTPLDLTAAIVWRAIPDPSLGGYYALGPGDVQRFHELSIPLGPLLASFQCPGTSLYIYGLPSGP